MLTCHVSENTDGTWDIVSHDGLGTVPATSMNHALAHARTLGWSVSYVRSRPVLVPLVQLVDHHLPVG